MNPLNQDTLRLIEEKLPILHRSTRQQEWIAYGIKYALTNPELLKSAGLYTLQEMQTQMLNLLEKEEDKVPMETGFKIGDWIKRVNSDGEEIGFPFKANESDVLSQDWFKRQPTSPNQNI